MANIGLEFVGTFLSSRLGKSYSENVNHYRRFMLKLAVAGFIFWFAGFLFIVVVGSLTGRYFEVGEQLPDQMLLILLWVAMLGVFVERLLAIHLRQLAYTSVLGWGQYVAAALTVVGTIVFAPAMGASAAGLGLTLGAISMVCLSATSVARYRSGVIG